MYAYVEASILLLTSEVSVWVFQSARFHGFAEH